MLVQLYLRRLSRELGRDVREIAPEALEQLHRYSWPGNIRELQSVLRQALLQTIGTVLLAGCLPDELSVAEQDKASVVTEPHFLPGSTLAELERQAIQQCLMETSGNRQKTAEILGISTRTLLRKIRTYGLEDPLRAADSHGGQD